MLIFRHSRDNDGETEVGIVVDDDQEVVVDQEALVADEDEEVVDVPLFQVVVAEVVVVATLVVADDLYDVVRDDVLKDLVRADVDQVGVDNVNVLLVVDELFVVVLSDADSDVSHVDFVVNSLSLSLTLVDELYDDELYVVLLDADLVSHLVDVVVAYLKTFVVKFLVVELYLYVVVVNLYVVIADDVLVYTLDVVDVVD